MRTRDLLKKSSFKRWLKKQHMNSRIQTGCDSNCPLTKFLLDSGSKCQIGISNIIYRPQWTREFIEKIDEAGANNGTLVVSPKQCLTVLDSI